MTPAEATLRARAALQAGGIDDPGFEARLLVAHLRNAGKEIDPGDLDALVDRRVAHEPMAFILGTKGFWTLDLEVSPVTLIPRPDSETLVEAAIAARPDRTSVRRVLDLGTGTGCLLLAVLEAFPGAWGVGVDLVPQASGLAARNAARAALAGRAGFLCGDWADAIAGRFDLVLCNPPYIESAAIAGLMPEVCRHEPSTALDGGADGLDAYRRLLPELARLLAPGGIAVLELGQGQAPAVIGLAEAAGLAMLALRPDLGLVDRALVLSAPRMAVG